MFTGLIEEIGRIKKISNNGHSAQLIIQANKVIDDIHLGDSISTNGVCLTVVAFGKDYFVVDVMPETMHRSNFVELKPGSPVNLERAMKLGQRFGGHIVSGHIDGVGMIMGMQLEDNSTLVTIKAPPEIMKYIIMKGSIAIDGISLTVSEVDEKTFKISIIPLTKNETTLLQKQIGDTVNLECDVVGKYIEKFITMENSVMTKSSIDIDFLRSNGFM